MDYKATYEQWCTDSYFDEATKAELKAIADDEKEIEDRFYRTLEFGTAGLRGVIGAGTNRMNIYTVRQATQGASSIHIQQRQPTSTVTDVTFKGSSSPRKYIFWPVGI